MESRAHPNRGDGAQQAVQHKGGVHRDAAVEHSEGCVDAGVGYGEHEHVSVYALPQGGEEKRQAEHSEQKDGCGPRAAEKNRNVPAAPDGSNDEGRDHGLVASQDAGEEPSAPSQLLAASGEGKLQQGMRCEQGPRMCGARELLPLYSSGERGPCGADDARGQ